MQWFELEVFGILASYLNHYLWLRPIIEPMQGKRHPFPEFAASAGILVLYWLIFRMSYVFRRPSDERQEHFFLRGEERPLARDRLRCRHPGSWTRITARGQANLHHSPRQRRNFWTKSLHKSPPSL